MRSPNGTGTRRYSVLDPQDYEVDDEGCHLWLHYVNPRGYGMTNYEGQARLAHRVSWALTFCIPLSEVPPVLDHMCHTVKCTAPQPCKHRRCLNVDHLDESDRPRNSTRTLGVGAENKRKERCPQGHEYDILTKGGARRCRTCDAETMRKVEARRAPRTRSRS